MIRFFLRFLSLGLLVILLAVGGCRRGESGGGGNGVVIGFSNASVSNSWRAFMLANFKAEIAEQQEMGTISKVYITNANDRPEKQIADVEDLLVKGIDVLIISPATQDGVNPAVEKAYEQGIPVVVFDRKVTTDAYTTFIETSNYEMGKSQARALVNSLDGEGRIVMLSGVAGSGPAEDRARGAREVFEQNPGIEIIAHEYTDWDLGKSKKAMTTLLEAHADIDGIWADSGMMSWPALEAMQEAGRPLVPSTGDHINGYAKFLVANGAEGYIHPFPSTVSRRAVEVAVRAAKGEVVEKYIEIPVETYGPDEIQELAQPSRSDFWWVGDDDMPDRFLPEI